MKKYDIVGSFLRPEVLKKARIDYKDHKITLDQLLIIENASIVDLIQKQKALGLPYYTDGEFRRETWHLDFMWGIEGIHHTPTEIGLPFVGENALLDDTYLIGKLQYKHHPFIDHFDFIKDYQEEDFIPKLTIPAPAQFLEQFEMPFAIKETLKYYENLKDFHKDVINVYRSFIQEFYDHGGRVLQLDDCSWGLLVDKNGPRYFNTDQLGLNQIKEEFLDINNEVIKDWPNDLIINTHVCRGNFHSTYAASGGYDAIASYLFSKENVNTYYLEFDDDRSGGFECLKEVSDDKNVVLGLITTKRALLENKNYIINRIKEASQYIPLERLSLSPQCGFASCEVGNKLTENEQWKKLKLVKEIAEEVWGE